MQDGRLEARLEQLELRLARLEGQLRFYDHVKDKNLDCTQIVREWFRFNYTLSPGVLVHETKHMYEDSSYRMAVHRMLRAGELVQVRRAVYVHNDKYIPSQSRTKRLTQEEIEQIKQDTSHSHGEIARLYNVNVKYVRKLGHKGCYVQVGDHAYKKVTA